MVCLVVALGCEAKPIIARYRLQARATDGGFRVYERDGVWLVIAGVGKIAAAAATAYLHRLAGGQRNRAWVNIGIAGHGHRPLGEGVLAHKITDQGSGQSWYPPLVLEVSCGTDVVLTLDRVDDRYDADGLFDMEAAGFYAAACRFATAELVQCFKVVSDNRAAPPQQVSGKWVQQWIADNLDSIDGIIEQSRGLAAELARIQAQPQDLAGFLQRWRFTVYQQNRLKRVLQRWQALAPHRDIWQEALGSLSRAEEVLDFLEHRVETIPTKFD